MSNEWKQVSPYRWMWVDPVVPDTHLEVTFYKEGTPYRWVWVSMPDYTYRGSQQPCGYKDIAAVRRAVRAWKAYPGDKSNMKAECCGHSLSFCQKVDPTIKYL